ncbi:nuclear transport factor 2 family protein [Duganella sp. FT94W]|uniref:Nuclear transport factor 2 family protein n=1 Tax=Duganella lactea TaxID=2692173 RepID=A0ABW9V013_9BURK|nr:nuclear transport factor 2 family protein [Duganella lactea]MYM33081.1 nuclear transport factor 2 family protein [Duganella lactea]
MDTLTLPAPIAHYFASEHHPEALAQCFTANAVVTDDGHTYTGIDAIKAFMAAASAKYNATTVPFSLTEDDGLQLVRAKVSGHFSGSPVNLSYRFCLEDGLIGSLEITV